jgi:hypothetical protein
VIELDRLDQICDEVRNLTAGAVTELHADDLERAARVARRLRELADRFEVHTLGQLDATGATDDRHGSSTAAWFAAEAGITPSAANAQIRTARILTRFLPETDQEWLNGTITRDHVAVMVRAANPRIRDLISDAERELLDLVDGRTFAAWKDSVDHVVSSLDEDGPEPDDPANTTASWSRTGDYAALAARFMGCDVEVLEQVLDHRMNALYRAAVKDRDLTADLPLPTRAQLRGQAIKDLLLEAGGITPGTRARVAVNLVLRGVPQPGPTLVNGLPTVHPDGGAPDWPVLSSLSSLTWSLSNLNGDHLVLKHFEQLLCDCDIHPMLVDTAGNPLKLGRTVWLAPPKLRKAVLIRDGGCGHPGCDAPVSMVDVHHVKGFTLQGGLTDIDNLIALCRRHHGVAHRKGWSLTAVGDGWFWWSTPSGHGYWSQRHGTQRAGPAPPHTAAA